MPPGRPLHYEAVPPFSNTGGLASNINHRDGKAEPFRTEGGGAANLTGGFTIARVSPGQCVSGWIPPANADGSDNAGGSDDAARSD